MIVHYSTLIFPCDENSLNMTPMQGVLKGVRVLDMTRILAGPFATMIFGDMGADVIKIESPQGGDDTRFWGPPFIGTESVYFMSVNRNKRSVAINMKQPQGLEILHRLVKKSDIFVENFLPGKLDAMGMGYKELKKLNKGLVYCSISGFGPDGPLADRAGYDVIASSMGGLVNITGPQNGDPCKVGVAVTDITTGLLAHGAILAALRQRELTGVGDKIDCDLLSSQVAMLTHVAANYLNSNIEASRLGTAHPNIVPYQAFKTKDGLFLTIGGGNNKQFKVLCNVIGCQSLGENPKFLNNEDRLANREELIAALSEKLEEKTRVEWLNLLEGSGIPYGPINNMKETFSNPQVLHNNMIMEMEHPGINQTIRVPGTPVKYSNKESNNNSNPPPMLGQHTREVLKELADCNDADIDRLVNEKVVLE
uniref:Succinate--hydroxymethylglutarate CoA-transferase-like n=1 Tax=Phallusia mammillata TaxID=59560 RepID=A0A6F9DUL1_9ASCI|nr:succinate--hydroxymethylglutarate CoA-transferase-like [Phallusia mammillata]